MSKYPYPVLSDEGTSYKEDIFFEITYIRNSFLGEKIVFEFDINMNSECLKALLFENKAKMYIKLQSNICAFIVPIDVAEGKCYIDVEVSKIQSNDTLRFVAYILANEEMELSYHDEMLDIYKGEYKARVRRRDLLAKSNEEILSYNTSNNDFIKFSVMDELSGNGYCIKISENFINVGVGPEFNGAYGVVKNNNKEVCMVFDSHLVFEVFVFALVEFVQEYEDSKDKEVYSLFEQMFIQTSGYKDMESFITNVKDDGKIDMTQIYEVAHKMVNNQIENSIISVSKMEV